MRKIPHARGVNEALRAVHAAAQKSLKGLNQIASDRMTKGDYVAVEGLAAQGKTIREFQSEVDALRKRWREVCGAGNLAVHSSVTSLWVYFQPILQGLVSLGGEGRRGDIEGQVERIMSASLLAADRDVMADGQARWQAMIRRARRPMVAEGWIERGVRPVWEITDAGRRAAEKSGIKVLEGRD